MLHHRFQEEVVRSIFLKVTYHQMKFTYFEQQLKQEDLSLFRRADQGYSGKLYCYWCRMGASAGIHPVGSEGIAVIGTSNGGIF
jgi:hypothetical protein